MRVPELFSARAVVHPKYREWMQSAKDAPRTGEAYQQVDNSNLSHLFSSDLGYTVRLIFQQWIQAAGTPFKSPCAQPTLNSNSGVVPMLKNVECVRWLLGCYSMVTEP